MDKLSIDAWQRQPITTTTTTTKKKKLHMHIDIVTGRPSSFLSKNPTTTTEQRKQTMLKTHWRNRETDTKF